MGCMLQRNALLLPVVFSFGLVLVQLVEAQARQVLVKDRLLECLGRGHLPHHVVHQNLPVICNRADQAVQSLLPACRDARLRRLVAYLLHLMSFSPLGRITLVLETTVSVSAGDAMPCCRLRGAVAHLSLEEPVELFVPWTVDVQSLIVEVVWIIVLRLESAIQLAQNTPHRVWLEYWPSQYRILCSF